MRRRQQSQKKNERFIGAKAPTDNKDRLTKLIQVRERVEPSEASVVLPNKENDTVTKQTFVVTPVYLGIRVKITVPVKINEVVVTTIASSLGSWLNVLISRARGL